jgi:hypothetical protein
LVSTSGFAKIFEVIFDQIFGWVPTFGSVSDLDLTPILDLILPFDLIPTVAWGPLAPE